MSARIRIDQLPDYRRLINPAQKRKISKRALRRANAHLRAQARKFIRQASDIKAGVVTRNIRLFVPRGFNEGVQSLAWIGNTLVTGDHVPTGGTKRSGGWARIYKGQRTRFPSAFIIRKNGKRLLRQRKGRARYPIEDPVKKLGIRIGQFLRPHMRRLLAGTRTVLRTRILHEMRVRARSQ